MTQERPHAFSVGEILCNRFRIIKFIAQGGMGEVYEAEDLQLGVTIAVKSIRREVAEDPLHLHRFKREVTLARQVTHPNVCRIFDLFTHQGTGSAPQLFLTMELLHGENLRERLRRVGRIPTTEAQGLVADMAEALTTAHRAGVVHRDLKTENVFIVPTEEGGERAVITDFGLAHSPGSNETEESVATAPDRWVGTPAYVSPEQLQGEPATAASDIYSFGILIFEMITGKKPFEGKGAMGEAVRRLIAEPTSPKSLVEGLDPRWEYVILRCLKRDPGERFRSADEIIEVLRSGRKHASGRLVLLLLAGAAALVGGAWLLQGDRISPTGQRPTVAVIGFRSPQSRPESAWLGTALAEMTSSELAAGEQVILVPSVDVARAKLELELDAAESYSSETLGRLRSLLGSDFVVMGSFLTTGSRSTEKLRVDLRVQDTRNGKISVVHAEGSADGDLFNIVSVVGAEIRRQLGVEVPAAADTAEMVRSTLPANRQATRLYTQGLDRLRAIDYLAAQALLTRAIEVEPDFPLAHSALARVWAELGFDNRALQASERAFQSSEGLPRAIRLEVEAQYRSAASDWPEAIAIYRSLWTFFPETGSYGVRLAEAHYESGAAAEALATLDELRQKGQAGDQLRLDLLEARFAGAASVYDLQLEAARRAAASAQELGSRLLLAQARHHEGKALWNLGETGAALVAYDEAREIFKATAFQRGESRLMRSLGIAMRDLGRRDEAEELFRGSLSLAEEIGDSNGTGGALRLLGGLLLVRGDLSEAEVVLDRAVAIYEENGDLRTQARALTRKAVVLRRMGDLDGAREVHQRAYDVLVVCGDRQGAAAALASIAVVLRLQGQLEGSVAMLERSLAVKREIGNRRTLAVPLVNLGNVHLELGDLRSSESCFREAMEVAIEIDNSRHRSYSLFGLGEVAFARGELQTALEHHGEALRLRQDNTDRSAVLSSLLALALVELEAGEVEQAAMKVEQAARLLEEEPAPNLLVWVEGLRARTALASGNLELAKAAAARAQEAVAGSDDRPAREFADIIVARIDIATGRADAAISRLEPSLQTALASGRHSSHLELLITVARAEIAVGRQQQARDHLETVLAVAEQSGYGLYRSEAEGLLVGLR